MPGSGGRIGAAPGDSTSLSYFSVVHLTGNVVLQVDGFLFGRDANHLATCPHIDRELIAERLFRRHQEARLFFNRPSDVVGQSAVRVGHIRSAFHHEDFGFFIQPAQSRRTRRAASHSRQR